MRKLDYEETEHLSRLNSLKSHISNLKNNFLGFSNLQCPGACSQMKDRFRELERSQELNSQDILDKKYLWF